jgi:hypothetical protein
VNHVGFPHDVSPVPSRLPQRHCAGTLLTCSVSNQYRRAIHTCPTPIGAVRHTVGRGGLTHPNAHARGQGLTTSLHGVVWRQVAICWSVRHTEPDDRGTEHGKHE